MKNVFSILFYISVIIVCVLTVIKGVRTDYIPTTIVGDICTVMSVIVFVWEICEHFKRKGRHSK